MAEIIRKVREFILRWISIFVAWGKSAWCWLRTKSAEMFASSKKRLEEKNIPEKTKKLKENASRLGVKAQEISKEKWSTLKEKSAEAEASAKKYIEDKNIPEKTRLAKEKGEKWYGIAKRKCVEGFYWTLDRMRNLWTLFKQFYDENIAKSIPSEEITQDEITEAQHHLFGDPDHPDSGRTAGESAKEPEYVTREYPSTDGPSEDGNGSQEEASHADLVTPLPLRDEEEGIPEPEPEVEEFEEDIPELEKQDEPLVEVPADPVVEAQPEKTDQPLEQPSKDEAGKEEILVDMSPREKDVPMDENIPAKEETDKEKLPDDEPSTPEPPTPDGPQSPKKEKKKRKKWSWKKRFALLFLFGLLALPLSFVVFCYCVDTNAFGLFGSSPSLDVLKNPIQMEASEIYSEDNDLIGKFFVENRSSVTYEEMSPELVKTLIYTEDQRFYEHNGIDYHGMMSAAKDALRGHARGASTITQQLVKNLFKMRSEYTKGALCRVPGVKTLIIKIKECIGAVRVEKHYTKEEILTMYLNTVTFGNNTFGIKSAAKTYFNTTPDKLTYEQSACIIGILKANTYYNPIKNPENNKKRRNVIIHLLSDGGVITPSQCDSLCALDLGLNVYKEDILSGYAHYFREAVYNELQEWCEENNVNLYHDGLKIYTTIDSRMQKYAEASVSKKMGELQSQFNKHWGKENPWRDQKQHEIKGFIDDMLKKTSAYKNSYKRNKGDESAIRQEMNEPHKMRIFDYHRGITDTVMSTRDSLAHILKFLHCGFIAMDPHTGAVKAWVGDVDFYYWQYDKVTAKRQPGSTFKLFVYTEALRQGMCSCDTKMDSAVTWMTEEDGEMKLWAPQNASGVFSNELMTLKTALARSVNSVAVQVAKQVTPEKIVATAHRMGIESPVRPIPSICLGTEDVSLIELATAYSVIADGGMLHKPILVNRIEDKNGNVIYRSKVKNEKALDYETAFLMRDMLQEGLRDERGTSQGLYKFKIHGATDFGGKTGTSANYSDAWYMNITPHLVTGAWVGGEYRSIHFRNGELGQGSRAALPIVGAFLEKVLNDKRLAPTYKGRFGAPKSKISKEYNCKPIEQVAEQDTTDSAMRSFFKRLFGRDDEYANDSLSPRKSRKEMRRERREKRREERRRRW